VALRRGYRAWLPAATAFDYEFAAQQHHVNCRLCRVVMVPELIPPERLRRYGAKPSKLRRYAGPEGGVLPPGRVSQIW
jgi:predicted glycosyltransferase